MSTVLSKITQCRHFKLIKVTFREETLYLFLIKSSIKSSSSLCGCGLIRFDPQWSVNISKQIHNYHHIFIQTLLNPNWHMGVGPCDSTFFKLIHACENKNINIGHVKNSACSHSCR